MHFCAICLLHFESLYAIIIIPNEREVNEMLNFCAIALCMIIMGEWVISLDKGEPWRICCNTTKAILLATLLAEFGKII